MFIGSVDNLDHDGDIDRSAPRNDAGHADHHCLADHGGRTDCID